jgi:hypothetical protein
MKESDSQRQCQLGNWGIPEDVGRKGWAEQGNERKEKKVQRISK